MRLPFLLLICSTLLPSILADPIPIKLVARHTPPVDDPPASSLGHAPIRRHPVLGKRAVEPSDDLMSKVIDAMHAISTTSWENGTMSQAILEYSYPTYSVFTNSTLLTPTAASNSIPPPLISIASSALTVRIAPNASYTANDLSTLGWALVPDESAGDPASLGIAVLMANASTFGEGVVDGVNYGDAVEEQLDWLLVGTPRSEAGAISQRTNEVQLWADFMYMAPPFLAYYGFATTNQSLLMEAYTQCSLYRDVLRNTSTNLWQHIALGSASSSASDPGYWATGNGWAASGMMRVLATIRRSTFATEMADQVTDLQGWVEEILYAASNRTASSGLVHNYVDQSSTFEDPAGSSLLAHAAYRLATENLTTAHAAFANQVHSAVFAGHVNSSGYMTGAVDPLSFGVQGSQSPEGQSFLIMLQAAHGEYLSDNGTDTTSAGTRSLSIAASAWMGMGMAAATVTASLCLG